MGKLCKRSLFCLSSRKSDQGKVHTCTRCSVFSWSIVLQQLLSKNGSYGGPHLWSFKSGSLGRKYWRYVFKKMFAGVKDSLLGSSAVLLSFALGLAVCGAYFKPKQTSRGCPLDGVKKYIGNSLKKPKNPNPTTSKNTTPNPKYYKSNI